MMKVKWSDVAQLQLKEVLLFYTKRNGSNQYSKKLKKKVNELRRALPATQSMHFNPIEK